MCLCRAGTSSWPWELRGMVMAAKTPWTKGIAWAECGKMCDFLQLRFLIIILSTGCRQIY